MSGIKVATQPNKVRRHPVQQQQLGRDRVDDETSIYDYNLDLVNHQEANNDISYHIVMFTVIVHTQPRSYSYSV